MYAIVEIAGKQYKVSQDDTLYVATQEAVAGTKVTFDRVLLIADGENITVGSPAVEGASVQAVIVDHVKGDKVLVFKKKRRKRYKVKNGHRQPYTKIKIEAVSATGAKEKASKKAAKPKAAAEAAAE
ncbi:MAG: 50S ribosomal protein L21 [Bacteroidetes bacterium]|nr:50S ribosomal protein L21 [Bacteroidota bacterium]